MFACTNIHTTHICVYARKCTYVQSVCTHNRDFVYKVQRQPQQQQHQQQHQRQQFTTLEKWLKYPHVFLCYVQYMLLSAVVNAGFAVFSFSTRHICIANDATLPYINIFVCVLHSCCISLSLAFIFGFISNIFQSYLQFANQLVRSFCTIFFVASLFFFCLPKHLIDSLCILSVPDAFTNLWRTT